MRNVISTDRAQQIASHWHGGQWSALYQFCSSKTWLLQNALSYVWEVLENLQPEYFAKFPQVLTTEQSKELNQLKDYFLFKAQESSVPVELAKHSQYHYEYPLLSPNGVTEVMEQVKGYEIPF